MLNIGSDFKESRSSATLEDPTNSAWLRIFRLLMRNAEYLFQRNELYEHLLLSQTRFSCHELLKHQLIHCIVALTSLSGRNFQGENRSRNRMQVSLQKMSDPKRQ